MCVEAFGFFSWQEHGGIERRYEGWYQVVNTWNSIRQVENPLLKPLNSSSTAIPILPPPSGFLPAAIDGVFGPYEGIWVPSFMYVIERWQALPSMAAVSYEGIRAILRGG